jgi:hypothetical protein
MIRDFMTKPLQGALFQKFRDQILGVVPAQDPGPGKAKTKLNEFNTHSNKPTKGKELKPSRGKSTIYNLVPSYLTAPQECVGRSDMNKGQTLKESHMYEKRPT